MSIHPFDRLEQFDKKNLDWFVVNWCLGNTCNYACSYCPVALHDGSRKWQSLDTVKAFIRRVKQVHPTKKLYFEFTGGEVTVNKDFIEICKFCHEQDVKVGFISNGSRTIRWWEENKKHFDHVAMSFHIEYADPDHFYKVIETLRLDVATHINIMMHPERWDECLMIASRLKQIGDASIALQPLLHDLANEMYDYTPDQLTVFENQYALFGGLNIKRRQPSGEAYRGQMRGMKADGTTVVEVRPHEFISKNTNNWNGWECWTGIEQLVVDKDGSVYRGWCKIGGAIGHVSNPEIALPVETVICNKSLCHCNYDIMCSKQRKEGGV